MYFTNRIYQNLRSTNAASQLACRVFSRFTSPTSFTDKPPIDSARPAAKPNRFSQPSKIPIKTAPQDERRFLMAQNDPDIFGAQQSATPYAVDDDPIDPSDLAEAEYLESPPNRSQKLSTKQYADMIKEHVRNKRIKEAIDVLEVRMLREDRVRPENYIFNLLISECARFGYTKKAFGLYTRMKQRGLKVTGATYTALFNACATTPWLQDGLNKANRLREIMLEKGYEPNATNYNAMIKAYGRAGDLRTAFSLVDEMTTKRMPVDTQTYNFLLQACATDRELGFRHALLVWHKMRRRRMVPDIYSFNSMLRCVRDCGIGDLATMERLIGQILTESQPQRIGNDNENTMQLTAAAPTADGDNNEKRILQIRDDQLPSSRKIDVKQCMEDSAADSGDIAPNLLCKLPHLGHLVALSEVQRSEDRLLLCGGASGFLREMDAAKAEPDIKTFTQLIEVIPPTIAAEKKIIATVRRMAVKCDIDFFNVIIKKRSMRYDYDGAKEVLTMIQIADLKPDIVTYGVLALGCRTPTEADELLQEMYDKGVRMNIQILGAMLKQGCVRHDFPYVLKVMKIVLTERIKPNEQFLRHLQSFYDNCSRFKETDVSIYFNLI